MNIKISSGKEGHCVLLYPNENSHLSVRSNTLLILSSGKGFRCPWKPVTSLLNQPTAQCSFAQSFPCPRLAAFWGKGVGSALKTNSHFTGVEVRKKRLWQIPVKYKPWKNFPAYWILHRLANKGSEHYVVSKSNDFQLPKTEKIHVFLLSHRSL